MPQEPAGSTSETKNSSKVGTKQASCQTTSPYPHGKYFSQLCAACRDCRSHSCHGPAKHHAYLKLLLPLLCSQIWKRPSSRSHGSLSAPRSRQSRRKADRPCTRSSIAKRKWTSTPESWATSVRSLKETISITTHQPARSLKSTPTMARHTSSKCLTSI